MLNTRSINGLSKENLSLYDYLQRFKEIYDNLAAIEKPLLDVDKVFRFSKGLGNKNKKFQIAYLSKPPYPSFTRFIMLLLNFEQVYIAGEKQDHYMFSLVKKEEEEEL